MSSKAPDARSGPAQAQVSVLGHCERGSEYLKKEAQTVHKLSLQLYRE